MNAFFTSPFSFIGLLAVPALVAIYLLRNRFRIHHVSSLMLWVDQREARQGGLNITRVQAPLLFLLELLTILLLTLAAAGPMMRSSRDTRIFVVILDDSFSMLADDGSSPRARAVEGIRKLLSESGEFQAHFILAGRTPQLVGEPVNSTSRAAEVLENWKCLAPLAELDKSIALGSELAGKTGRMLVVTDHPPEAISSQGRIEWWAFGKPLPNVAFVNAGRKSLDGRDRCFLAVANLSGDRASTKLTVESLDTQQQIMKTSLSLKPHEVYRTFFESKAESTGLQARLEDDSLDIDNEVVLFSKLPKPVRVRVSIKDDVLRSAVRKALDAARFVDITSAAPQLLITDSQEPMLTWTELWTLQIVSEPDSAAYLGPFVVDHSHPLTEGLALGGVIWGAGKTERFAAMPVIAAGNIPLLTDKESPSGSHNLTLNLDSDRSTLLQSPNWPILMWNLIQWRRSFLPGLAQPNIVLGSSLVFVRDSDEKELLLVSPDHAIRNISDLAETVYIEPDMPGVYTLKSETNQHTLAVNALAKSESDLTGAGAGRWGKWEQAGLYWWEYRPIDWIALLFALALLTAHRFITANYQKGVGV